MSLIRTLPLSSTLTKVHSLSPYSLVCSMPYHSVCILSFALCLPSLFQFTCLVRSLSLSLLLPSLLFSAHSTLRHYVTQFTQLSCSLTSPWLLSHSSYPISYLFSLSHSLVFSALFSLPGWCARYHLGSYSRAGHADSEVGQGFLAFHWSDQLRAGWWREHGGPVRGTY